MLALFLFLILGAIVLGFAGVVLKGLFYFLIIGVVVFVADLVLLGARWSRRSHTESPWLYARDRMNPSESDRVSVGVRRWRITKRLVSTRYSAAGKVGKRAADELLIATLPPPTVPTDDQLRVLP